MFSQAWQVGLDIQNSCIRALIVQHSRRGWRLRSWWQHRFLQPILREGCLESSNTLITVLKQWRTQLPKRISLRIALPAQRVLQRRLPVPDPSLREPLRHDYITQQGLKQFPLDSKTLALDYRTPHPKADQLLLTAARKQELQQWLQCLESAELYPQVIEITPSVLSTIAYFSQIPSDTVLLHRLEQEWLWVAPRDVTFLFGVLPLTEADSISMVLNAIYAVDHAWRNKKVYYSGVQNGERPKGVLLWSPFTVFSQLRFPLPELPAAFVLAAGLALRLKDH